MKKLAIILALVILTGCSSVKGDVNGDGVVDDADFLAVKNHIKEVETLTDKQAADVNKDGKINAFDLIEIQKILEKK